MRGGAGLLAALLLVTGGAAHADPAVCAGGDLVRHAGPSCETDADPQLVLRRRAIAAARAKFGTGSVPAAVAQAALAHAYIERQRWLDAEPLLLGAKLDLTAARGSSDPALAALLADLARVALARGAAPEAERLARQAVAIAPAGPAGPRVLGAALAAARRFSEAEAVLDRALARAGDDGAEAARTLSELARLYLRQDRWADALPLIERAIAIDQRRLPANDPLLAADWYDLGVAELGLKRLALADRVLRLAIDRLEQGGERATPRAANIGLGLARALHQEGRHDEARVLFERAQQILTDGEQQERQREART